MTHLKPQTSCVLCLELETRCFRMTLESWSSGVLEQEKAHCALFFYPLLHHSNSALVAIGYYGEDGYSSTPYIDHLAWRLTP
jgi:hypothetical protein